jgi:glutamate synthase domain-containing protein 2/glutamate synthase domain-containing protein 1/glutamate synthase domain-containing protein 3
MAVIEEVVRAERQTFIGWRRVPTDSESVGAVARQREPEFWHIYVGQGRGLTSPGEFDRKLFVIRKQIERRLAVPGDPFGAAYIASLSPRTLVYKGMLRPDQLSSYFPDLRNPELKSALAMVHSRFSTNTLPRWPLAQPFRYLSHNGEINTLRGNINWMRARESTFSPDLFGEDIEKLCPVLTEGGSDSQNLDNALELLCLTGRSLPHAMMMLIPEAWEHHQNMSDEKKAFYDYHSCIMEPWDGPATIPFTDGRYIGAVLDRNGLRPSKYTITQDGLVVMASETGVLDIAPEDIREKGRLSPGKMFLVDLKEGRVVSDDEIKADVSARRPYREWLNREMVFVRDLDASEEVERPTGEEILVLQRTFGYTLEDIRLLIRPMITMGKEPLGSMGADVPLAVLSDKPRLLYDYFKQLFAQVTNPPLDAIREQLVTSLKASLGREEDIFSEHPRHAHRLRLDSPVLSTQRLSAIRSMSDERLTSNTLSILYDVDGGGKALRDAVNGLCREASAAVAGGASLIVLSDRGTNVEKAPIPALLATAAVHHHLIRSGRRTGCSLIVESGEPREIHHLCLLIGYGASAVNPYLLFDTVHEEVCTGRVESVGFDEAVDRVAQAVNNGILKVMSKMGISTLQSYCGAQIFEAVGLSSAVVERYFTGTPSRLDGVGLDVLAEEARLRHAFAYPPSDVNASIELQAGGLYQWRRNGEHHLFNPLTIAKLQQSVRQNRYSDYDEYARLVNEQTDRLGTIRGLMDFRFDTAHPVPIDEVEPWTEIVKRFKTGAMSFGSISQEAHESLAQAMNRIGGRSNTGEGGEAPERYGRDNSRRSRIKQVASGRFGVTIDYLTSADEIQIKMAQGAKPGEGGQLPGKKVYPWIARTRHSTPYVGLISPPPHHDIYSIEDLAQLIFDLKNANPSARISVKLVSEVGVGTVAAGVAKGKADLVLISGYDGGTGASPKTSIMHAGLPWELGLAETHQALVQNGLRGRIRVECDGQLKTGRDVAIAALLGADEFGFATAPLVALGCIMMRKCHLNTCPVGIATQDPELRKKFSGDPEHVINFFHFLAEELRTIMAGLGFRTLDEMTGRVDMLKRRGDVMHWKARHLDLDPILTVPKTPDLLAGFDEVAQKNQLEGVLDHKLIDAARQSIGDGSCVEIVTGITNRDRATGTLLSHEISRIREGVPLGDDTIKVFACGSAGQSCGAFLSAGVTLRIEGDTNDYLGKGLSGGKLIIVPPPDAGFIPNMNIIVGNVALYGATSGALFARGQAGERFAVRNSGANAVVEGLGDHGCEYMTGGRVVVLGPTGRNFAAGMSGGIAYVMDGTNEFRTRRCNTESIEIHRVDHDEDVSELRDLVSRHLQHTGSDVASWVLENWDEALEHFVKVMPTEYRKALERIERERVHGDLSTSAVTHKIVQY